MNGQKFLLLTAATLSLFSTSVAQAETLNEAVVHAINHHPTVKASTAGAQAAKQQLQEEKAAYYPSATASASFGRIYADNTTTRGLTVERGAGYSWFGEGSARLTQTLYDFQARDFSVKSAAANFESLKSTRTGAQQTIAIETASAYVQLLRASHLLREARDYQMTAKTYYDRIETAFDNGGADESEVSRAQDFVSLSDNLVLQFENGVTIAQASYKQQVGRLPDTALVIPDFPPAGMPATVEDAIQTALAQNGQLAAAHYTKTAIMQDFQREKTNTLPTLEAELSVLKRDQADIIGGESEDARALVRMNWNYSLGGAQKAAKKRVAMQAREAEYNFEATQRTIERDITVAWARMDLASKQKMTQLKRFEAAQQTVETYEEQYEGGQQSLLEMLSAESALFRARQDYLNAVYQEMSAAYTVLGLAGIPFYQEALNTAQAGTQERVHGAGD